MPAPPSSTTYNKPLNSSIRNDKTSDDLFRTNQRPIFEIGQGKQQDDANENRSFFNSRLPSYSSSTSLSKHISTSLSSLYLSLKSRSRIFHHSNSSGKHRPSFFNYDKLWWFIRNLLIVYAIIHIFSKLWTLTARGSTPSSSRHLPNQYSSYSSSDLHGNAPPSVATTGSAKPFNALNTPFKQHSDSPHTPPFYNTQDNYPTSDQDRALVMTKLFQYSLKPSNIIPYYIKAQNSSFNMEDVTIATLITVERLAVLENLVQIWNGPISAVLHVNSKNQGEKQFAIRHLKEIERKNPLFKTWIDLHLIIDTYDRQFNMWRNAARLFARTNYILMLDVDFRICTDLREKISVEQTNFKQFWNDIRSGQKVFVVPAFEFTKKGLIEKRNKGFQPPTPANDDLDHNLGYVESITSDKLSVNSTTFQDSSQQTTEASLYYPETKQELKDFIKDDLILSFHAPWRRGHGPTNYVKWETTNVPYKVEHYNYNYEPYIIMSRRHHPWYCTRCDERFVGYGSNKAACLFELWLSGVEFWVMPDMFLIHQPHLYPEQHRTKERRNNRRLYDYFREETCHRYHRMGLGIRNGSVVEEKLCGTAYPWYVEI